MARGTWSGAGTPSPLTCSAFNLVIVSDSLLFICPDDNRRRSQVKLGSAADFLLDITETDLSLLTASIKAPSGRDEPCLLKRLPNNHIGKLRQSPSQTAYRRLCSSLLRYVKRLISLLLPRRLLPNRVADIVWYNWPKTESKERPLVLACM